jgi:DNA-binding NarL/FixJ family response regulator
MKKIKIAIADDHPIVVEGISNLLRSQKDFGIIATYHSGEALLNGLKTLQPDILLLDLHFPDTTGNDLVRIIARQYPAIKVLALTSVDNVHDVKDMMQNGCAGYILKSAPLALLVSAIQHIYQGEQFIEPQLKEQLVNIALNPRQKKITDLKLTVREQTLLKLLSEGKTNNDIAKALFLSHRTIENNRLSLYQKLGVHNSAELIKVAIEKGMI